MTRVRSSGGVEIAAFDLAGSGRARTLLVSHATGFHGHAYLPLAHALDQELRSIGFDYRGHGDTPQPPEAPPDWERYGDDAEAMATWLFGELGGPFPAFGHSMGGTCLLIAAHRRPEVFTHLVLYEPIVFPPDSRPADGPPSPLVEGARRRRPTFASYEAALANFAAKPPLSSFTPEALEAYVRHGFAEGADGQVHLKCDPAIESGTFAGGGTHRTWDLLPEITVPVTVIAGVVEESQPSMIAGSVAASLPNGSYVERPDLDHFGPMTHPGDVAEIVRAAVLAGPAR